MLILRFFGITSSTLSTRAFFRNFSVKSSRTTPLPGPRHPEHKKCSSGALKKFANTPSVSYPKIFRLFGCPDCSKPKKSRIKSTSIRKTSNQRLCATFDRLGKYSIAFEIARLKHAHGFRRILGSEASICINFPISSSKYSNS